MHNIRVVVSDESMMPGYAFVAQFVYLKSQIPARYNQLNNYRDLQLSYGHANYIF